MIEDLIGYPMAAVDTFTETKAGPVPTQGVPAACGLSRLAEFRTSRACAESALARLGVFHRLIGRDLTGQPLWPSGTVGSITHCPGYRAAAVGHIADVRSLGVDTEPNLPLPPGLLETMAAGGEQRQVSRLSGDASQVCWDRLLISAKESFFKAWFPLTGQWIDYSEAVVVPDPASCAFSVELLTGPSRAKAARLRGSFLVRDGLIITAVVITDA